MRKNINNCGALTQVKIHGQQVIWFLSVLTFLTLFGMASSKAADYAINYQESSIIFSGTHAGNKFTGTFEDWVGEISFDPDNLAESQVSATFNLKSAKTGNKMYDWTLPNADWFDVKDHPEGTFESTEFVKKDDDTYIAKGTLTLRGQKHPVFFDFTLSDLSTDPVLITATFPIDRLKYGIGAKSDPESEWVSQEIQINLSLLASKTNATD